MNRLAKMSLFALVAFAAIGIVSTESADAGCFGYTGWHATSYFTPTCYATPYYAPTPVYGYAPTYGYGSTYGYGYGYGTGYRGW